MEGCGEHMDNRAGPPVVFQHGWLVELACTTDAGPAARVGFVCIYVG